MNSEIIIEVKENVLISASKITPLTIFTKEEELAVILNEIEKKTKELIPNLETATSRKEIAAMAYKVSQSKTFLDNAGKMLVEDWKTQAKKVDICRKKARDFLDELRDKVRKPLTDWEEAEAERIKKEREEAEYLAAWDEAIQEHSLFLRQKAIEEKEAEIRRKEEAARLEAERIEQERIKKEREETIKKEAAEKAKKEAEEKAAQEKLALENKLKTEKEAREHAEREKIAAEERAKLEKELAVKQEREEAAKRREQEEKEKLELQHKLAKEAAKKSHRAKINNQICSDLIKNEIPDKMAKDVVSLVAEGKINRMSINYLQ